MSKLNKKVNYLWQRPKKSFDPIADDEWYDAAPIGRDPLNWHMKILSQKAKLSKIYTNHCIRATVITNLDEEGFEARDIMATTGHKSEASIRSYASKCPPKKRRMINNALAQPPVKKPRKLPPSATVSTPPVDKQDGIAQDL